MISDYARALLADTASARTWGESLWTDRDICLDAALVPSYDVEARLGLVYAIRRRARLPRSERRLMIETDLTLRVKWCHREADACERIGAHRLAAWWRSEAERLAQTPVLRRSAV